MADTIMADEFGNSRGETLVPGADGAEYVRTRERANPVMKVLLAAPFVKGDIFEQRFVTPPLGIWRIASFLRARGQDVTVYDDCDPTNEMTFEETVLSEDWDIIGFSVLTATLEYDLAKIHAARKIALDALIVAGGNGAALNYQFVLDNSPVDIVVTSEGEYPMLALCTGVQWQNIMGLVFKNDAKILTAEDYWDITKDLDVEAMHLNAYWDKTASMYEDSSRDEINTFRLFTSNYCPMGCAFCTLTLWKKYAAGCKVPVVALNPEQVMELIHRVVDTYSEVKQVFFVDDDFFLSKSRSMAVLKWIIIDKAKGILPESLAFIILTNINRVDDENIELMKQAGVRILSIGVESTSQHVLDSLDKKQTVETIWSTTQLILDSGIKPYYTLLMFTPYCTQEDLLTDLEGFRRLSDMGVGLSVEPYLIPLPGTPLWEARVPESTRWVPIEGTDKKIKKGFAWLPVDHEVRKIFTTYEEFFPKYKTYRYGLEEVKHKEKNYTAGIMLDCLEVILKAKYGLNFDGRFTREDCVYTFHRVSKLPSMDIDTVGNVTEKEEFLH